MTEPAKQTPFARFFSSVEGHLVSRYGTATPTTNNTLIGARRSEELLPERAGFEGAFAAAQLGRGKGGVTWQTDEIVALSELEAFKFRREYDRAVKAGALKERTEAEYLEFVKASKAKAKEVEAAMAKEAKEAEEKAKAAAAPPAPPKVDEKKPGTKPGKSEG